jgi:hypothetical protein
MVLVILLVPSRHPLPLVRKNESHAMMAMYVRTNNRRPPHVVVLVMMTTKGHRPLKSTSIGEKRFASGHTRVSLPSPSCHCCGIVPSMSLIPGAFFVHSGGSLRLESGSGEHCHEPLGSIFGHVHRRSRQEHVPVAGHDMLVSIHQTQRVQASSHPGI